MKRIGTLGYLILGLITTSAFAQTSPTLTAPATESSPAAPTSKHKKGGKKHSAHKGHKSHKKKDAPAAEQK